VSIAEWGRAGLWFGLLNLALRLNVDILAVIPAKAGIQLIELTVQRTDRKAFLINPLDSGLRRNDGIKGFSD
jgi:hypothetical protein